MAKQGGIGGIDREKETEKEEGGKKEARATFLSLGTERPRLKRCCSVTESCPTLCDPRDCGLPGSSVHGIS